jgi:integrase
MFDENPTRTNETVTVYIKRAKSLAKRAMSELGLAPGERLDARQFVAWLETLRPTLSKASWRQYKSSVVCFLEGYDEPEALEAVDYLRELDTQGCSKTSLKTSGSKLKRFSWRDFQKITDHLRNKPGKWHRPLLDWLICGCLTGLRPQEWVGAQVVDLQGEKALVVKNAKGTNGRSHGPTRTLLLSALSIDELQTLRNHIERATTWAGMDQFDEFYDGCSLTLYYVSRKLWPRRQRHVTLYSCRHQFTANAKASGFSTAEIAAMMGHRVDTTATKHYGKKVAGNELLRVRALESDVDRVEQKFHARNAKAAKPAARPDPVPKPRKPLTSDPLER